MDQCKAFTQALLNDADQPEGQLPVLITDSPEEVNDARFIQRNINTVLSDFNAYAQCTAVTFGLKQNCAKLIAMHPARERECVYISASV